MPFPHFVSHENAFDRVHGAETEKKSWIISCLYNQNLLGHSVDKKKCLHFYPSF